MEAPPLARHLEGGEREGREQLQPAYLPCFPKDYGGTAPRPLEMEAGKGRSRYDQDRPWEEDCSSSAPDQQEDAQEANLQTTHDHTGLKVDIIDGFY